MCGSALQYQFLIMWGHHPLVFIPPLAEINAFSDHPIVPVLWGHSAACLSLSLCVRACVCLYLGPMTCLCLTQNPNEVTYSCVIPRKCPRVTAVTWHSVCCTRGSASSQRWNHIFRFYCHIIFNHTFVTSGWTTATAARQNVRARRRIHKGGIYRKRPSRLH